MKKYLVIGNPLNHSLSSKLHNFWIKKNNLNATYKNKELNESDIEETINDMKSGKVDGINVTLPYKKNCYPIP